MLDILVCEKLIGSTVFFNQSICWNCLKLIGSVGLQSGGPCTTVPEGTFLKRNYSFKSSGFFMDH